MRAAAVLAIVASAAHADPLRVDFDEPRRRSFSPVIVITPRTPRRPQPNALLQDRVDLQNRVLSATGLERIAALDSLTLVLEEAFSFMDDGGFLLVELDKHYAALVAEPLLETYPYADELMARAADELAMRNDALAIKTAERLIAKFPKSPFAADARLALGKFYEVAKKYALAKQHLDVVIAKETRESFVQFAHLRRAWVKSENKEHEAAVVELRNLAADPKAELLHEPAIDLILNSYVHVGRVDQAILLFDSVDRRKTPTWLRDLSILYGELGNRVEEVAALRAAIARDGDPREACLDRAQIVLAMARAKRTNRVELLLAIAELEQAVPFGDKDCARAAERAIRIAKPKSRAPGA